MSIFRDMHAQRSFQGDHDFRELKRMLAEAESRGFVERVEIPVGRPLRWGEEWFLEIETGEMFKLTPPEEKVRGEWVNLETGV